MKARISNLHKTEADWQALAEFTPAAGELIVYDADNEHPYPRLKIGDGDHKLSELPFIIEAVLASLLQDYLRVDRLDAGRINGSNKT